MRTSKMHGARPKRAARLDAMSAAPRRTSCSDSPTDSVRSCSKRLARRRAKPESGPGVPTDLPRRTSGTTISAGRDVVQGPGTCRCRAGLTWSASAIGTNVGCVMRGD